jgi:hypothetical protein
MVLVINYNINDQRVNLIKANGFLLGSRRFDQIHVKKEFIMNTMKHRQNN